MAIKHSTENDMGQEDAAASLDELCLRDCFLIEVMPLAWIWAYRRLLDPGHQPSRFGERIG